jgi:hypothetical protein
VLLASLPSPLAPSLGPDFDRGIEAIERAAQSQRYVPQARWLPWREKVTGKPGWLLFRRDDELPDGKVRVELLLVLVVGERPVGGIDRDELRGALNQFKTITERAPGADYGTLAFLGPYYSGTAESLVQQTGAWCAACEARFCAARTLVAVSGTATRRRTKAIVEGLTGVFKKSEFGATVLPDDLLVAGMHRFIKERLAIPPREIAELTETSTDYGNAVATRETARPDGAGLTIALPLNVALLATEQAAKKADPKAELSDHARIVDLALDGTFSTLSRNGVNHVGILATTTRDKVFVVGQLRQSAPDLRVHMYESSIELADPTQRQALEGLMVASSYPVFAETQLWRRQGAGPLVPFPSESAEGIYNALLGLLARFDPTLEKGLSAKLLDYRSPFCAGEAAGPSVWVSVSITGQLWPLVVYSQTLAANPTARSCVGATADPYLFAPAALAASEPPPLPVHASFLTLLGALAVLVLIAGNLLGLLPLAPRAGWRAVLVSFEIADGQDSPLPADGPRHAVAMLGLWSLAVAGLLMGKVLDLPTALPAAADVDADLHHLALALCWGSFVLVATACLLSIKRRREKPQEDQRSVSAGVQTLMCIAMLVAIVFLPVDASVRHPDGHAYFFFVRATDPGVGLTPTIPLFMVGTAIYVASLLRLMVVRRAEVLASAAKDWPPPPPPSFKSCATAMDEFAAAASRSLLPACALGTAFGFLVLYVTPMRLGSLEGRGFDAGCSFCFSLVFTLTLAAAWRAHSLWYRLRDFTRALAIHPAAAALARLPVSVAQRFRSPVPGQVGNQQIDVALAMTLHALGLETQPTIASLLKTLDKHWFPHGAEAQAAKAPAAAAPGPEIPTLQERTPTQLEEDLLVLRIVAALGFMCDATRSMLFIATGTGLTALLACALYPFQPAATLTAAGLVSVGIVVIVALRVLLGIERDKVLSDVAGTTPGKVTPSLGLLARIVGYVVVPLGGLIGSRLQDPGTAIELLKSLTNALNR